MLQKGDKKTMNAWAFYDWANSVYPLVISTAIFPIFYGTVTGMVGTGPEHDLVPFLGWEIKNTVLYEYVINGLYTFPNSFWSSRLQWE